MYWEDLTFGTGFEESGKGKKYGIHGLLHFWCGPVKIHDFKCVPQEIVGDYF